MILKQAIIAGYICLDMTPDLSLLPAGQFSHIFQPGRLVHADGFSLTAGGVVPNTGLSLHRLGVPVRLIAKISDDLFGQAVQDLIQKEGAHLVDDLVIDPSLPTAFTIIINPPGFDRAFLCAPGANRTFYASDLPRQVLQGADLFHFGYPTLMRSIYRDEGGELVSILLRARRAGLTTSLDFSLPDPTSRAAQVDWKVILANALPFVDLFVPSLEELLFLLDRESFDHLCVDQHMPLSKVVEPGLVSALAEVVLGYGVKAVLVKLGQQGVYLRTAPGVLWKKSGRGLEGLDECWFNREIWAPAFQTKIQSTTGAGDAAVAGFLASILKGTDPGTALKMASALGAISVETTDVTRGITTWEDIHARVTHAWETLPLALKDYGWQKDHTNGLWEK